MEPKERSEGRWLPHCMEWAVFHKESEWRKEEAESEDLTGAGRARCDGLAYT